ncbi:MAG: 23S rRNA (uracil(1939)-C(5))-methyltransferase RlmD [Candidatus Magnetomorum sp.]|nr:23S rRNA (uracil(1939)-C(5))-methyltransferase RlmD [Candidatus Magnetomorum sp.]
MKKGAELQLTIDGMAIGGRGLAKQDGMVIFVDHAVEGDIVLARIVRKKKQYAEARTLEILFPSPYRIAPLCSYNAYCGGCKWQFIDYNRQIVYKQQHIAEALHHIGGIKDVLVHPTMPSPDIFEYRNKMEFSCSDRRWLMRSEMDDTIDRSFALGLHVPGTFDKVLDIQTCLLQQKQGNAILSDVRSFMKQSGEPAYGLKSHQGFWRFCVLRHSRAHNQWMVNIVTSTDHPDLLQNMADSLCQKHENIASFIHQISSRKAAIAVGESEKCLKGQEWIEDYIGPFGFNISASSFFQTNTQAVAHLYQTVKTYARLKPTDRVLDLFCGTGTIAIWLADQCASVTGIENVPDAVSNANHNCEKNNITNCRFICGDIKDSLPQLNEKADVVIMDPPRAGTHPKVIPHLLSMGPRRIIYVSCNPSTLARDLNLLSSDYRVAEVQPVDMFPHTFHTEAVARLEKKSTGSVTPL